jgi:ABC-type branched-subunit amino acid transport system ATPase component
MAEALRVENLTAGYVRDLPILQGVSLTALPGQVTVVIGPNGAGKSTLVKAVAGLVPVTAGRVLHAGRDITGLAPHRLAAEGIAYLPQTDNVFRTLTIAQNLSLAAARAGADPAPLYARFPMLAEKRRERAAALSGGQRQILALAMALAARPRTILMDEPSAGLSPKAAEEVLTLARGLAAEGTAIILVEQNVRQALRMADHCFILAEGRNQIDGPAAALATDPVVAEIYLGGRRMRA